MTTFVLLPNNGWEAYNSELCENALLFKSKRLLYIFLRNLYFRGKTAEEATVDVIENQLPEVYKLVSKGELNVENVDVFCEKGIFDVDQTRRILKEARKLGFKINFHGEEIVRLNSVEVCFPSKNCSYFKCILMLFKGFK